MKELLKSIEPLVVEELARANEKFPQFASAHEGYAILKEEIEEAEENFQNVKTALGEVWNATKGNYIVGFGKMDLDALKREAVNAAAELTQVAAMAQKFLDMLERMEREKTNGI